MDCADDGQRESTERITGEGDVDATLTRREQDAVVNALGWTCIQKDGGLRMIEDVDVELMQVRRA